MSYIQIEWLGPIFDRLRQQQPLHSHEDVIRPYVESSHIIGILAVAGIVRLEPPPNGRGVNLYPGPNFQGDNQQIIQILRDNAPDGTQFTTPIQHRQSRIVRWEDDRIIYQSLGNAQAIQNPQSEAQQEAQAEIERRTRLAKIAQRPQQQQFSAMLRQNYGGKCAITGCNVPEALEAAHIRVYDGQDDNAPENGILLRADIHALFDALLITFSANGRKVEICPTLINSHYNDLSGKAIAQPTHGSPPSLDNVNDHRQRFTACAAERNRKPA